MNDDKLLNVLFALCALLGIAWTGFCVWAIYQIVTWVTSQ